MSDLATTQQAQTASGLLTPLALELIRDMIARRYGFYVNQSWSGQLAARIAARTAAAGFNSQEAYIAFLLKTKESGSAEMTMLVESILNGETHFMRTAPHFNALIDTVLPAWRLTGIKYRQKLRIASLGCSTGEEPYSLALTLRENLPTDELALVEITAVDISGKSLNYARVGCYEAFQLRDLSPEQRKRWFSPVNDLWKVSPELKDGVRFMQHNLMHPLPFAGLDVIFCRNVMIYFNRSVMANCLREFHAALRPGGFLFLGHAESAIGFPEYFEPLSIPDGVIYQNKATSILPQ